jgi:hypothetical protein
MILDPVGILTEIKTEFGSKLDTIVSKLDTINTNVVSLNTKLDSIDSNLQVINGNTQKYILIEHIGSIGAGITWTSDVLDASNWYRYMNVVVCNSNSVSSGWIVRHIDTAGNVVWEDRRTFSAPRQAAYGYSLGSRIQVEFKNSATASDVFRVYLAVAVVE